MNRTDDGLPAFNRVKNFKDLKAIEGYMIENIIMNQGKSTLFLKSKITDKVDSMRELFITDAGNIFLSDEYFLPTGEPDRRE